MPEIEPIKIYNLNINNLNIPKARVFDIPPPVVNNLFVPVTVDIGNPIIEMPGCVKDHPDGDEQLTIDDPKGTKILCTNEYPSYDAMDYTPEDLVYQQEAPVPPTNIGVLFFLTIRLILSAASLSHFPVEKTAPEDWKPYK